MWSVRRGGGPAFFAGPAPAGGPAGRDPSFYGVPDAGVDPTSWTQEVLEEAGSMLDGVQFTTHSLRGDPASALLDVADRTQADLILVGNRGMARRVLGSVPNTVAH